MFQRMILYNRSLRHNHLAEFPSGINWKDGFILMKTQLSVGGKERIQTSTLVLSAMPRVGRRITAQIKKGRMMANSAFSKLLLFEAGTSLDVGETDLHTLSIQKNVACPYGQEFRTCIWHWARCNCLVPLLDKDEKNPDEYLKKKPSKFLVLCSLGKVGVQ